jgi:4-hydroxythreonine-4-phosphate dehydrogenase
MVEHPRLCVTMGDVAGVGPEIIAKAWPVMRTFCRPVIVGNADWMRRALKIVNATTTVREIDDIDEAAAVDDELLCLGGSDVDLGEVVSGSVNGAAGKAAFDFLCKAIDLTMAGRAAGIVTAPLHKEGLRRAGLAYPGHTEILAERTGTPTFAMVLYGKGLSVIHVTLHMALRDVLQQLTSTAIVDKTRLLNDWLSGLLGRAPRLGVAALNPHASDGGLFGQEEALIIRPAVEQSRRQGIDVTGPWACDTLFVRAKDGAFDGIIAMYHDQGHIAMKLLGIGGLVNVTVGLPIIRTSVAHGTAYDIAGKGTADPSSLIEAARLAIRLAARASAKRLG